MICMEDLDKLKIYRYLRLSHSNGELVKIIKKILSEAEYVYTFRCQKYLLGETELIKWIKSTSLTNFKKVEIELTEINRIEEIKSVDSEENVYVLKLNETTRNKFIELFKIPIGDANLESMCDGNFHKWFPAISVKDEIYTHDRLYNQYDFVFTIDNKVLLLTDIHSFEFHASEEVYYKVQEKKQHTLHNIKCKKCGNVLTRTTLSNDTEFFVCNYGDFNIGCFKYEITVNNVEEAVLQIIKTHVKLVIEKEKTEQKGIEFIDKEAIEKEISKLEKIEKNLKQLESCSKLQIIQIQLEHFKERVNKQIKSNDIISSNKNLSFDKLTREIYDQFVSEVIVGCKGKLEIKMKDEDSLENK